MANLSYSKFRAVVSELIAGQIKAEIYQRTIYAMFIYPRSEVRERIKPRIPDQEFADLTDQTRRGHSTSS